VLLVEETESSAEPSSEGASSAVVARLVPCRLGKTPATALSVETQRETMLKASKQQLIDRVVDKLCFLEAAASMEGGAEGGVVEAQAMAAARAEAQPETGVATTTETQRETLTSVAISEAAAAIEVNMLGEEKEVLAVSYIDLNKKGGGTSEEVGPKEESTKSVEPWPKERGSDNAQYIKGEEAQQGVVEQVVGRWSHTSYYDLPGVKKEDSSQTDDANFSESSAIKTEDVSSNCVTSKSSLVSYSLVPSVEVQSIPDEVAPISNGTATRTKESTSPVKSQCVINTPQDVCHEERVSNVVSSPSSSFKMAAAMEDGEEEEEDEEMEYCSEEVSASASLLRLSENFQLGAATLARAAGRAGDLDDQLAALKGHKTDDADLADGSLQSDGRRSSSRACKGQRYRKFMMEGGLARGRRGRKGLDR